MGRSKCYDNVGYSDSLNKDIAFKLPVKEERKKKHYDWYLSVAYKRRVIILRHFTQRSRKKCLPLLGFMCVWPYTHILVHVARIFTSCQSSTIGSVRTSHKTLTINSMIQYSKFHFLILFRKIINTHLFLHLHSSFFYWKLTLKLIQYIKYT